MKKSIIGLPYTQTQGLRGHSVCSHCTDSRHLSLYLFLPGMYLAEILEILMYYISTHSRTCLVRSYREYNIALIPTCLNVPLLPSCLSSDQLTGTLVSLKYNEGLDCLHLQHINVSAYTLSNPLPGCCDFIPCIEAKQWFG